MPEEILRMLWSGGSLQLIVQMRGLQELRLRVRGELVDQADAQNPALDESRLPQSG